MAWSLCWASVNIVVVLFLLATFSSPPTLPPRLWGESTEPQNIARVRQNKAPMCARYNNLQCLPCHPKLLEHTVFQPCLPTFLHAGEPCSLLLSSTGAGSVSAPSCPSVPVLRSSSLRDHGQVLLTLTTCRDLQESHGFSEMFGACWKLVTASK